MVLKQFFAKKASSNLSTPRPRSYPAIGIDLGTTNSCIAHYVNGSPKIIPNSEDGRVIPSCVTVAGEEILVGSPAIRLASKFPENAVFATKRLIGSSYDSLRKQVESLPMKVVPCPNGEACVKVANQVYTPSEIASMILKKLKNTAEETLQEPIKDVVITVPAYFSETQRSATSLACKLAGLNPIRIINEPTAAALAYGFGLASRKKLGATNSADQEEVKRIVVYDLGGGTFDVSILELQDGVFDVLATNGDRLLGGEDVDSALQNFMLNKIKTQSGINVSDDEEALKRVREACELLKKKLTTETEAKICLPFIANGQNGPFHFDYTMTRSEFESIARPIIERTIEPCLGCLNDANLDKSQIDDVILVGGMTRVPLVRKIVSSIFDKPPRTDVNPDEAVALGAAIQAGIINGQNTELLLVDVTPLSLGIETLGGAFTKIIEKNSTIPIVKSNVFTTALDNQTEVRIKVYQGDRAVANKNLLLGEIILKDLPPAKRGEPQIEVSFNIDVNGLLHVSAKDLATGKAQSFKINYNSVSTSDAVKQLLNERKQSNGTPQKIPIETALTFLDQALERAHTTLQNLGETLKEADRYKILDVCKCGETAREYENVSEILAATRLINDVITDLISPN